MPSSIIGIWLRGIVAIAIVVGALVSLGSWYDELPRERVVSVVRDGVRTTETRQLEGPIQRIGAWSPGIDRPTAWFAAAIFLALWSIAGSFFSPRLFRPRGADEPNHARLGEAHRLLRSDGTDLRIETYGRSDGIPVVVTHGWGNDSTQWYYLKRELADRFRLIVWDLPGSGLSSRPPNRDFSLERMARDLRAVVDFAGGKRAILVGHSIGGMIIMTYCRLFPETLGSVISGIALAQSTYTNPVRTRTNGWLLSAIQKPIIEPLLHLTIWLSPLVWVMNWLSYWNGSTHRSAASSSFAGTETRGQLDFAASFQPRISPAVVARGSLAMLDYEAPIVRADDLQTLVIAGDRDSETPREANEELLERCGGGAFFLLAPAKHLGVIERHEEFARRLIDFCSATAAAAGDGLTTEGRRSRSVG